MSNESLRSTSVRMNTTLLKGAIGRLHDMEEFVERSGATSQINKFVTDLRNLVSVLEEWEDFCPRATAFLQSDYGSAALMWAPRYSPKPLVWKEGGGWLMYVSSESPAVCKKLVPQTVDIPIGRHLLLRLEKIFDEDISDLVTDMPSLAKGVRPSRSIYSELDTQALGDSRDGQGSKVIYSPLGIAAVLVQCLMKGAAIGTSNEG